MRRRGNEIIAATNELTDRIYKGRHVGHSYRLDLLVEDRVIVEVKALKRLTDLEVPQVLTGRRPTRPARSTRASSTVSGYGPDNAGWDLGSGAASATERLPPRTGVWQRTCR